MSSSYFESLDYGSQKRHVEKLKMREIEIPDPYSIADDLWVDNPAKWPNVEFGDIYIYLIDTKGDVHQTKLKGIIPPVHYTHYTIINLLSLNNVNKCCSALRTFLFVFFVF